MNRNPRSATVDPTSTGPGWRDYRDVLRRQAPVILVAVVLGGLIAFAAAANTPKRYTARSSVRLTSTSSPFNASSGRSADLTRAMLTEIQVAKGDAVEHRIDAAGGTQGATLDAIPGSETDTIVLSATASDRDVASDVANAYATAYLDERAERVTQSVDEGRDLANRRIADLNRQITELSRSSTLDAATITAQRGALADEIKDWQGKVSDAEFAAMLNPSGAELLTEANPPAGSVNMGLIPAGLVGAFLGFLVGLIVAGVLELLTPRVRSAMRARRLVEGVPTFDVRETRSSGALPSELRVLAAALRPSAVDGSRLVVALPVAGSVPARDSIATLAMLLARSGVPTALVDVDSPSDEAGIADVLRGERSMHEVVRAADAMPLRVVTSGLDADHLVDLDGDALATSLYELAEQSRVVLVLLPPPLESTMTATVTRAADDVLVVLDARALKRDVTATVEVLDALGADVSSLVFVDDRATGELQPGSEAEAVLEVSVLESQGDPAIQA